MTQLGIFVGEDMWTFFREIYAHLEIQYDVQVFAPPDEIHLPLFSARVNRWRFRQSIRSLLQTSDICFFEWASEYLQIASQMPKSAPIVTRLHSFELYDWAPKINWENVDKIIFVCEHIRQKFIDQYPKQADKTVVVYNAIPVEKFPPVQRKFDFSIGMLGHIAPIKRIYEIILLTRELLDMGYSPSLHIAGREKNKGRIDRYYVAVHQIVQKLKLQDHVKFYGHVDNPGEWFQNIDIFISNSYWEGLHTALLEAMAAGCYCLGHFWDGVEEALPLENIYTTEGELKQKLIEYAALSDAERETRTRATSEIAQQKFNIHSNKVKFTTILEDVMKRSKQ
ncbi:MAG TPA: glycosyltransferase [Anaerolineales bacterium]|nr:glycosyltransferase [Anaerolineales bacterium]